MAAAAPEGPRRPRRDRRDGAPWTLTPPPPRTDTAADVRYELKLIWRTQWRAFHGLLRASPERAWIIGTALALALPFLLIFWGLLFAASYFPLHHQAPGPTDATVVNLVAGGLHAIAAMFTLVAAGTTLTHSGTIPLLFTLPLRRRSILAGLVAGQLISSLWAAFLATAPALGLLAARGAVPAGAAPAVLATLATSLAMGAVAVWAGATVVRWLPAGRWQEWILALAGASGASLWYIIQGLTDRVMRGPDPAVRLADLDRWIPPWSPLGWPGSVAALAGHGRAAAAWLAGAGALAGALALIWILVTGLEAAYRAGLAGTAGAPGPGARAGRPRPRGGGSCPLDGRGGWRRAPVLAMARREWRRLARSPRFLAQELLLLIPLLMPLLANPELRSADAGRLLLPLAVAQGAGVTAMHFIGNEEAAFWVTRLTPLRDREVILGKALALWGLFTAAGAALAFALGPVLDLTPPARALAAVHTGLASLAAVGAGLWAGASEPVFFSPNKQHYAGAAASLATTFGLLFWLAANGAAYAGWLYLLVPRLGPAASEGVLTAGLGAVNIALARWALRAATGALARLRLDK